MNKRTSTLLLAVTAAVLVLALGLWWAFRFKQTEPSSTLPKIVSAEEEKAKQSVASVLDKKVGKGHYVVAVKATFSDTAEESQQITLKPNQVTLNRTVMLSADQPPTQDNGFEKLNIPIDARIQGANPKRDLPGFPLLSVPSKGQHSNEKNAQPLPYKIQKQSTGEVYYSQSVTKITKPIQLKRLAVFVIVDEKRLKRLHIQPQQLAEVLKQAAAIDETNGDRLALTAYPFSENFFGLSQYFWETQETMDALNLSIWGIAALLGAGALAYLFFTAYKARLKKRELETLITAKKQEDDVQKSEEEKKHKETHFKVMCKELVAFVEGNPLVTANVMAELAMSPPEPGIVALSLAKKAGYFLLFLESEAPETAKKVLLELGEDTAKIILSDHQKYSKIDEWTMFSIIEELYTVLVQKKQIVSGPTLSNKLYKNTFGKSIQDQGNNLEFSFHFIGSLEDSKLMHFLSQEPLQLSALMFSFMEETRVAALLSGLPSHRAVAISKLMVVLDIPSYSLLEKLSSALETRLFFQEINSDRREKLFRLSRIIEKIPAAIRDQFMLEMENVDKDLIQEIKAMVFTFEDLHVLSDDHLAYVLAEAGVETVAISILRCTSFLEEKILRNVSDRMKEAISETQKISETIPSQKIEKEQSTLLKLARQLAVQGKIVMEKTKDGLHVS
jgi:flagellar motor switch protein FliG